MKNIAVFISGGGSNLQALIDNGFIRPHIALVVCSNDHAYGLERAKAAGIKTAIFQKKSYDTPEARDEAILKELRACEIDYIVLGAYLGKITPVIFSEYKNKIINIHPSLLPDFGGQGFWGIRVHESVIASGIKTTGASVHFVDEEYDTGPIIMQEAVEVRADDTAESLQKRVLEVEHRIYPIAVEKLLKGEIK